MTQVLLVWIALLQLPSVAQDAIEGPRPPGRAIPDRPADIPLSVINFEGLTDALNRNGRVRILVRLRSLPPESGGALAETRGARGEAESALSRQQGSVLQRLSRPALLGARKFEFIPFMALEVEIADFYRVLDSPEIDLVEEDVAVPPTLSQSVPLIGADGSGTFAGYTGAGSTVAILDTGVDSSHSFLAGKVVDEACYSSASSGTSVSVCPNGQNSQVGSGAGVNCSPAVYGCDHGTHVAGIAAGKGVVFSGVAKDASIISIQVFSRFNSQSNCGSSPAPCALSWSSDQLLALQRVYALRGTYSIAAVNMSLGGGSYSSNCDSSNVALKTAIDNLRSAGIATIIASGNSSSAGTISSPACISTAISVGATTKSDTVAGYSNSASILNLLAPGSSISSSIPGGAFASWSGTSMAAPHVAGAWAVLKSKKPGATVDEVLMALKGGGTTIVDSRNGLAMPRIKPDTAITQISSQPSSILWRHSDGRFGIWNMSGTSIGSTALYLNGSAIDNSWKIVGVGDFNSDGNQDFLWRQSGGALGVWYMNGVNLTSTAYLLNGAAVDTAWSVAGVADMNADGKPDILWQCSDGRIGLWLMNGINLLSTMYLYNGVAIPTTWKLVGAADFNKDGKPDLFWQCTDGRIGVWYMNGVNVVSTTFLYNGQSIPTSWKVVGLTDFNGDNETDILWQNTDGTVGVWFMNGVNLGSTSYLYNGISPGSVWSVAGAFKP